MSTMSSKPTNPPFTSNPTNPLFTWGTAMLTVYIACLLNTDPSSANLALTPAPSDVHLNNFSVFNISSRDQLATNQNHDERYKAENSQKDQEPLTDGRSLSNDTLSSTSNESLSESTNNYNSSYCR